MAINIYQSLFCKCLIDSYLPKQHVNRHRAQVRPKHIPLICIFPSSST